MQKIFKLEPFHSDKIWGYEKWTLSTHKNGNSKVENKDLKEVLGYDLPILIKTIKADEALSVQVHPSDDYSRKYENDNGKTECWYILDAKEDASLICGIKDGLDREKFSEIIENNKVENYLEKVNVKKGDMIYIPAGTVHAIEGGLKILEVQQSSDVTYRIYDWGRDREMHIEKSLDVIDYKKENKGGKIENFKRLETPYFTVEKIEVKGEYSDFSSETFNTYTVIDGDGYIESDDIKINLSSDETVFIDKNCKYRIVGNLILMKYFA